MSRKMILRWISCLLTMVLLMLCGCSDNVPLPTEDEIHSGINSTSNVLSAHWDYYVMNDQYMIGPQIFLLESQEKNIRGDIKYNFKTKSVTSLCSDELCSHSSHSSDCKLQDSCVYYFTYENSIYYSRYYSEIIDTIDVVDDNGNIAQEYITEQHQCFCAYDITTGDYREFLNINVSESAQMYRVVQYNGNAYYWRHIPNNDHPKSLEDYTRSLCAINLKTGKEQILFSVENLISEHAALIFISDNRIYFADNTLGTLLSFDLNGENLKIHLDGQGHNIGLFDKYGTFKCGDWIYYAVSAAVINGETYLKTGFQNCHYLYRLNVNSDEKERLSNDLISFFNITNGYIYYFLSAEQYDTDLLAEANPIEGDCSVIVRIRHDGSERTNMGYFEGKIAMAWIANEELYISDLSGAVRLSLNDGRFRKVLSDEVIK